MATSTSNTVPYPEIATLCHQFYSLGKRMNDLVNTYGISNTVMNGVCVEVKTVRGALTNTNHVAFLVLLAAN